MQAKESRYEEIKAEMLHTIQESATCNWIRIRGNLKDELKRSFTICLENCFSTKMTVSVEIFLIYLHLVNSIEEIERSDGEDGGIDVEESSALGRVGWRVARQQHLLLLCEFTHY